MQKLNHILFLAAIITIASCGVPTTNGPLAEKKAALENLKKDQISLLAKIKAEEWNTCHLIIKGNILQHYINGILMSEVTDNDTVNGKPAGLLGVQVHVGPPMKVEYRNIRLKQLK